MRRLAIVSALIAVVFPAIPRAAHAAAGGRVVVVAIGGTSLDDWAAAGSRELDRIRRDGAAALLSARTGITTPATRASCLQRETAAVATMLDGRRVTGDGPGPPAVESLLDDAGMPFAAWRALREDAAYPTGFRTDYDLLRRRLDAGALAAVTVVLVDDGTRADCSAPPGQRARWVGLALRRAGELLTAIRSRLTETDTLIVLSPLAPVARERQRNFLTPIAAAGGGSGSGGGGSGPGSGLGSGRALLTSDSTRRAGVVALVDVAPTILRLAGVPERVGPGNAIRATPGRAAALRRMDDGYAHAAAMRRPLLRGYVWSSAAIVVASMLVVVAGRGRASGRRLPRTGRDVLAFGATAIVAAPAAMLAEPALGLLGTWTAAGAIAGTTAALALVATWIAGPRRAPAFAAGVAVALVAGDLAAGGPLSSRSAISYSIAEGARFYGIGNELLGVLVAGALVWASGALDAVRRPVAAVVAVLAALAVLMAAPPIGAKFGAAFVAVPAFGVLAARALGHRLHERTTLAIAIATVLAAAIVRLVDAALAPDVQTHIARLAATPPEEVLSRKIGAALRLLLGSYWTGGIAIAGGAAAAVLWRRPVLAARALWGRPFLRTALLAAIVAAVTAVAFNDAGVVAASIVVLVASAALCDALLGGQTLPPHPGQTLPPRPGRAGGGTDTVV